MRRVIRISIDIDCLSISRLRRICRLPGEVRCGLAVGLIGLPATQKLCVLKCTRVGVVVRVVRVEHDLAALAGRDQLILVALRQRNAVRAASRGRGKRGMWLQRLTGKLDCGGCGPSAANFIVPDKFQLFETYLCVDDASSGVVRETFRLDGLKL